MVIYKREIFGIYVLFKNILLSLEINKGVKGVLFSKKLRNLVIEVEKLDDNKIYRCEVKDKKGKIMDEELVEIVGKELKTLAEMQGIKSGMIRYNKDLFYDVIAEKEKAPK